MEFGRQGLFALERSPTSRTVKACLRRSEIASPSDQDSKKDFFPLRPTTPSSPFSRRRPFPKHGHFSPGGFWVIEGGGRRREEEGEKVQEEEKKIERRPERNGEEKGKGLSLTFWALRT